VWVQTTRRMIIPALWPDNARWELLGTRLRDEEKRKALSRQCTECVAHDGGHDGHLADDSLRRHHVAAAVGALLRWEVWGATSLSGCGKKDDVAHVRSKATTKILLRYY
jgi:hypothetical protein